MAHSGLSRVGEIVRQHDPDRFFTALFAPAEHRETLFTLYAFNHELARASEVTREPIAALIRLQWWREVVEGARRRHEVAGPLGEALDSGRLLASDLVGLVDARECELDRIADLPAFVTYLDGTAGNLMVTAARALGMPDAEALRRAGAAYGATGVLHQAMAGGKNMLPASGETQAEISTMARDWLRRCPPVPRSAVSAALPITLARHRLKWSRQAPGARFAVLLAAVTGRL